MHSPCIREATTCFHGFCTNPSFDRLDSQSSTTRSTATTQHDFANSTNSSLSPNSRFTNHESLPSVAELFSNFTKAYPQYLKTYQADQIRVQEYYHLSNHVCLDYNGHGLFSYDQQPSHRSSSLIASTSTSAPSTQYSVGSDVPFFQISNKSANLYSKIHYGGQESEFESIIRKRITRFMNISEDEYSMVFTASQSSAFKLLAESYPFWSNRELLTVYDFQNEAVEIMIDCSKQKGAKVMSAKFSWPKMSIHSKNLKKMVVSKSKNRKRGLFVFPLQSKMTGARYSYQWLSIAQENGWHVLLDATASGAKDMETLGLSFFRPDFLFCSFYKIFGDDPSGFGCLFVKKSSASVFKSSKTKSIGIVSLLPATTNGQYFDKSSSFDIDTEQQPSPDDQPPKVELAFASSPSSPVSVQQNEEIIELQALQKGNEKQEQESDFQIIEQEQPQVINQFGDRDATSSRYSDIEFRGLNHADSLGLILIRNRSRYLINWLINALMSLQHPHSDFGLPLVSIYGPKVRFDRGPSLAFNIFDWRGEKVDPALVQKLADRNNISLGFGFLKNIWLSDRHEEGNTLLHTRTPEHRKLLKNKEKLNVSISVVTASLGILTNFDDTYKLWAFASKFLDADFVEKERWRYTALNQRTIEL
ncbi:hypothetical protein DCAR_0207615 [Daucus carota subsp. sativus]|uniref:Aminotransferase class V domain-containing protein n=1 Tax=Daucus carota subsp. sativus TaxID=79200 RepID=A0A166E0Q0_DAUCS|nr:PREDICTED: uncharacterized protein LOC108209548 [Daucus carota subsp. sativus]WOG88380.1 hypothetical protein DCAR_0207615 [Daucus carota subsp. sativus]